MPRRTTGSNSGVEEIEPVTPRGQGKLAEVLLVFTGIDSETDTLPIGDVRQHWRLDALERKDREITDAENVYANRQ